MDFDVVVLGTGLSESIVAAALSKAGFRVAHVDHNQYYGGDEASLTVDELAAWADARAASAAGAPSEYLRNQRTRYTSISRSQTIPPQSRQYSLSLAPSIVPSAGAHIDSLIASGVSRYGSFKLLEKVAVYDRPGFVQSVPGSKEDVFKSKALSLVEKRRLMRFLMFSAGEFEGKKELEGKEQTPFVQFLRDTFSLSDKPATAITYALAFCTSAEEPTLPALQRIRQYLRSAGRYGASPFLVGHYGGLGETAQGFCRTSAVKGGTYILGRRVLAVEPPSSTSDSTVQNEKSPSRSDEGTRYRVELEDLDEPLTAKIVVSSPDYFPPASQANSSTSPTVSSTASVYSVARCIAIVDMPLVFTPTEAPDEPTDTEELAEDAEESTTKPASPSHEVDTAVLVFPPGSLPNGSSTMAAHVLVTGEGSMSTPRDKWVLNISLPLPSLDHNRRSEELLRPYLDATLTLTAPPTTSPEAQPATPLFTVFYTQQPVPPQSPSATSSNIIITPPYTPLLPAIADAATQNAEDMFWKAIEKLGRTRRPAEGTTTGEAKGKSEEAGEKVAERDPEETDSFWPPLDVGEVETSDDW
ncbi:FAD/NAD-P-binding domain-containing protein [Trametes elegans]|nr:FAD/NAD-P-binding domain-containing protein [Trametes elegans]